ncbi:MAG: serine/threonine-protein kinase [Kiritimatiellae bacterium]|nr:serine/threonine-protein kinase [Kiritimatiellia bacterium]
MTEESFDVTEAGKAGIEAERVTQILCAGCGKVLDVSHLPSFTEIKCPACGMAQIVPARFGGFWLIGKLGSGGMGVIYHAMDKELGRHVALKVMKKELGANNEFVQSFKHEAQAAAALNHPNVVQIYSFGQVESQFYIAMELVSGGRLDEMIDNGVALEETRALEIHLQVVAGLRAASEAGLVHGDIKPANILFGLNGEAKVVDFGLASYIGQQQQGGAVWGTPYYIAPEKARGKRVDFRSDIYSLGATLFHVLTGQVPFDGATSTDVVMARLNQPAPNLLDINPDLHPETAALVARMLEVDPSMRHPSYPALQINMEAALEASRKPLKKSTSSMTAMMNFKGFREPMFNRKFLVRAGIGLAAVVVLAAIAGVVYASHRHQLRIKAEAAERQQMAKALEQGEATAARINALAELITQLGAPVQPLADRINKIAAANTNLNTAAARAALEIDVALDILNDTDDTMAMADVAYQRLQAAKTYAAMHEPSRQLESYFNIMIERQNVIKERKAAAEQVMADAGKILAQAAAAANQAREAAAQKAAREKAAKAAQELAIKQAAEAERQRPRMIQLELDMVDRVRGANSTLIAQRKFNNAAEKIVEIKGNLTQPEAQAYLKNVQDSYAAMAKLKAFIIAAIQKAPYRNGWTTSGTARDIIKANDKQGLTITLGTSGSIAIAWDQVTVGQLVKIANYYMGTAGLTDEARAEMILNTALFCYENGVFKTAETYAIEAGKMNPALKSEALRLMPGFAEE